MQIRHLNCPLILEKKKKKDLQLHDFTKNWLSTQLCQLFMFTSHALKK